MLTLLDGAARQLAQGESPDAVIAQAQQRSGAHAPLVARLVHSLAATHEAVAAARFLAALALENAGLDEEHAAALVGAVTGSGGSAVQPVRCSVERLELATAAADGHISGEVLVSGGPGRVVPDSPRVSVEPAQFGPGATSISIQIAPAGGAPVLTAIKLVSPAEVVEVPLLARWGRTGETSAPQAGAQPTAAADLLRPTPARPSAATTTASKVVVRTVMVISRVMGFPRALALQRAIDQIPGVVDTKALGFEQNVLNLSVQHEATVNLAEAITRLSGFPLSITSSSLGRIHLIAESR